MTYSPEANRPITHSPDFQMASTLVLSDTCHGIISYSEVAHSPCPYDVVIKFTRFLNVTLTFSKWYIRHLYLNHKTHLV